jgi:cytochrome c-type biogenesis protein CcmH
MSTFVIVAAIMAVLAAAAVAAPLIRGRSWIAALVAAVMVAGPAAALYPLWSNWDWHAPPPTPVAGPDVLAMVAKLEDRLKNQPNDATGWLMLGRSYMTIERVDDAVRAYEHADQLDPSNPDAALGLGEALSVQAGGNITPPASDLFEQAVKLAPGNPKALLYSGFAAAARGDAPTARLRWQALKDMHPPDAIVKMLDERMAELGPPGAGASAAHATVNISIAPELKARLTHEAPLFVFAREPGGQGPPLAAKRLTSAAIGTQIQLSAADSMIPSRVLVNGHTVSITARVSFSGQPLPAKGDLYGELTYDVGNDGVRNLVIDRVAE